MADPSYLGLDPATLYSLLLNIALLVVNLVLARYGISTSKALGATSAKLNALQVLIHDFIEAYRDRVITREEAERLMRDVQRLIEDP